jgi:protein-tyrosine-phosphatase
LDWDLPDPTNQGLDAMREVRNQIEDNVKKLIQDFSKE